MGNHSSRQISGRIDQITQGLKDHVTPKQHNVDFFSSESYVSKLIEQKKLASKNQCEADEDGYECTICMGDFPELNKTK